ncbi:hypothetical protein GCM10010420_16550 [Streptomyces glaucosporus]|uniref:Secreted protein n=1 Tax=Streptomyces glaucosporus TaxID=284044 RepID=A0ABN3I1R2_9ACTN
MVSSRAKRNIAAGWAVLVLAGAAATLALNGSAEEAQQRGGWEEYDPRKHPGLPPGTRPWPPAESCAASGPDGNGRPVEPCAYRPVPSGEPSW